MTNQSQPQRGVSCVGRLLWGSVSERQEKGYQGAVYEDGKEPFNFGLGVRKDDPGLGGMLQTLYAAAIAGIGNNPQLKERIDNEWRNGFTLNLFKFKIRDGDRPNAQGQINENSKGMFVFAFQTTLPVKTCDRENKEIDPKSIKTGYYVDVAFTANFNGLTDHNAGIFINPNVVRFIGFGQEIIGGISPEEAFKGHAAPTNLPPGASLTPIAPQGGISGFPGGQQQPGFQANGLPQQSYSGAGPLPNNGMPPGGQPPTNNQLPGGNTSQPYGLPGSGQGPGTTISPSNQQPGGTPWNNGYATPGQQQAPQVHVDPATGKTYHFVNGQWIEQAPAPQVHVDPATGKTYHFINGQWIEQPQQPGGLPGFPSPGNQPPPNTNYGTGFPSNPPGPMNPQTGQPVAPHTNFLNPPR